MKKEDIAVPKNGGSMFNTMSGFYPRPQTAVQRSSKADDLLPNKEADLDEVSE